MRRINSLRFATAFVCLLSTASWSAEKIEEIVVYGDFRERAASDLPASVTVLDAEEIEDMSVQHFEELINAVPNVGRRPSGEVLPDAWRWRTRAVPGRAEPVRRFSR
jgi:outer membrane receptor for ferrienterochelin and colicin